VKSLADIIVYNVRTATASWPLPAGDWLARERTACESGAFALQPQS
jgi:hypothetical protein